LGIGGSIIYSAKTNYLLDTGYKIYRQVLTNGTQKKFDSFSKGYVTKNHFEVENELAEGKIINDILHSTETLLHLSHTMCTTNKEIRQLQRWLLTSFPDTAAEYLFPDLGKLVEAVGDALLVHKCQSIFQYQIVWNQTVNGSCYAQYPVLVPDTPYPYFLDLPKRRLHKQGHKIPCPPRIKPTFISDNEGKLWSLSPANTFAKIPAPDKHALLAHLRLPKLAHFSPKLLHYDEKPPSRLPLPRLLSRSKENLEELSSFRETGGGSIISGIGMVLGQTISAVAKGGSTIIRSLGQGIHDTLTGVDDFDQHLVGSIGNATSKIIDSTSTGAAKVVSSLGGIGNIILWLLVIVLYIYVFIRYFPFSYFSRSQGEIVLNNDPVDSYPSALLGLLTASTPPPPFTNDFPPPPSLSLPPKTTSRRESADHIPLELVPLTSKHSRRLKMPTRTNTSVSNL